jgi:hypothetical protein
MAYGDVAATHSQLPLTLSCCRATHKQGHPSGAGAHVGHDRGVHCCHLCSQVHLGARQRESVRRKSLHDISYQPGQRSGRRHHGLGECPVGRQASRPDSLNHSTHTRRCRACGVLSQYDEVRLYTSYNPGGFTSQTGHFTQVCCHLLWVFVGVVGIAGVQSPTVCYRSLLWPRTFTFSFRWCGSLRPCWAAPSKRAPR